MVSSFSPYLFFYGAKVRINIKKSQFLHVFLAYVRKIK